MLSPYGGVNLNRRIPKDQPRFKYECKKALNR